MKGWLNHHFDCFLLLKPTLSIVLLIKPLILIGVCWFNHHFPCLFLFFMVKPPVPLFFLNVLGWLNQPSWSGENHVLLGSGPAHLFHASIQLLREMGGCSVDHVIIYVCIYIYTKIYYYWYSVLIIICIYLSIYLSIYIYIYGYIIDMYD